MKKIIRLTERDLTRIVKNVIREQQSEGNEIILCNCTEKLYKISCENEEGEYVGFQGKLPLIDGIMEATYYFTSDDYDEDALINALEMGKRNEVEMYQNILRCFFKGINFSIQDNNPLLTICRKTFTTMGMTDIGDKQNKIRAQKALSKLGILTKI